MANRNFDQYDQSIDKGRVTLTAIAKIGTTGAVTLSATDGLRKFISQTYGQAAATGFAGAATLARTTTGKYTLTLQDTYVRLLGWQVNFGQATNTYALAPIVSIDTTLSTVCTGGKVFAFVCQSGVGTPADPGSGETMYITLDLQNSSAV